MRCQELRRLCNTLETTELESEERVSEIMLHFSFCKECKEWYFRSPVSDSDYERLDLIVQANLEFVHNNAALS